MIFFPILFSKKKIKDVDFIVQDVPVVEIDDEVSDNNQGIDTFYIISNVSNGFYNKIFLAPNVDEGQDIHIQSISQEIRVDEVFLFFFFQINPFLMNTLMTINKMFPQYLGNLSTMTLCMMIMNPSHGKARKQTWWYMYKM